MHLGAVMERSKSKYSTYNIAIACTSGIGTSRLLASRLEKEFKNLVIVEIISTITFDENALIEKGIDFMVSTMPIPNCKLPVVVVNPLLMAEEKHKLEEFIKNAQPQINRKRSLPNISIQLKERLKLLNVCNEKIMQALDNFEVIEDIAVNSVDMLIDLVSSRIHENLAAREQLSIDLKKREMQGSVLLEQKGIMLLHCRTHTVNEIYFKLIRLVKPLYVSDAYGNMTKISIVALMLAPIEVPKIAIGVLSEITRALVENDDFVLTIKEDTADKVYNKLSFILYQFYQGKSMNNGI
jgi:mannitol operon transcriptional antiterminator